MDWAPVRYMLWMAEHCCQGCPSTWELKIEVVLQFTTPSGRSRDKTAPKRHATKALFTMAQVEECVEMTSLRIVRSAVVARQGQRAEETAGRRQKLRCSSFERFCNEWKFACWLCYRKDSLRRHHPSPHTIGVRNHAVLRSLIVQQHLQASRSHIISYHATTRLGPTLRIIASWKRRSIWSSSNVRGAGSLHKRPPSSSRAASRFIATMRGFDQCLPINHRENGKKLFPRSPYCSSCCPGYRQHGFQHDQFISPTKVGNLCRLHGKEARRRGVARNRVQR